MIVSKYQENLFIAKKSSYKIGNGHNPINHFVNFLS